MADKKTYTGLSKNYATVPAFSITTIDYLDTKPNYFRVQNRGTTEIYCSTNNMPTTKHYDFAVAGKKMKMFAEPYNRTRLYIFNPSGSDVEVAVLSFQAEFEPLTLALSEIEVEMPKEFENSMAITSFNAPLPAGNNKIGKVEITNDSLPAGNNMIGKVEVTNGPSGADIAEIKSKMETVFNDFNALLAPYKIDDTINLYDIFSGLRYTALVDFVPSIKTFEEKGKNTTTNIVQNTTSKYYDVRILKNDGEGELSVHFKGDIDSYESTITLKPGESITNFKGYGTLLSVSGTNYSFRAIVSVLNGNG